MESRQRLLYLPLAVLAIIIIVAPLATVVAENETVKVIETYTDLTTLSSVYMYNKTASALAAIDTSKVEVLASTLKDLDTTDDVEPCVVLNMSAPTTDLNTNETVTYAYELTNTYGDVVIGVADVNETDNTLLNPVFVKISPAAGDITIVRTSSDVTIYYGGGKLQINTTGYDDPKLLILTDGVLTLNSINYLELRALTEPPTGYTVIQTANGERTFTVSANGDLSIWFDENHQSGDMDLFVFDQSNPNYAVASNTQTWGWLLTHCDRYIFADAHPQTGTVHATGSVKFVVKSYNGLACSWRIAVHLSSTPPSNTETQTPSETTQTQPATGAGLNLAGLNEYFHTGNNAILVVLFGIIIVAGIVLLARR